MAHHLIALYDPPGIAEEDLAAASRDVMAVVRDAQSAGVWVFGGGLVEPDEAVVVARDGGVSDGPCPESKELIGGFGIVDVPSRQEALAWARRLAAACRCPQEVREFQPDRMSQEA